MEEGSLLFPCLPSPRWQVRYFTDTTAYFSILMYTEG